MPKHSYLYEELNEKHWIGEVLAFITVVIVFGTIASVTLIAF